jgi:hypothetical protein
MYFDGQLHYLEKDRQSPMSSKPQHQRASTTDSTTTQPPSSSTSTPTPSMPKSQTVGGAAGDLHSMALKSAINNIGIHSKYQIDMLQPPIS